MTSLLHEQPLLPHLIVRSLDAHDDAPCIHLAGRVATYAEIRRRTSQLIQATAPHSCGAGALCLAARPGARVVGQAIKFV